MCLVWPGQARRCCCTGSPAHRDSPRYKPDSPSGRSGNDSRWPVGTFSVLRACQTIPSWLLERESTAPSSSGATCYAAAQPELGGGRPSGVGARGPNRLSCHSTMSGLAPSATLARSKQLPRVNWALPHRFASPLAGLLAFGILILAWAAEAQLAVYWL